jgi:hypothetical protein
MEKVMPKTFIIEPARVASICREPSAPTPNKRGHWPSQRSLQAESASIRPIARKMLTRTNSKGANQKLDCRLPQSCLSLCMGNSHSKKHCEIVSKVRDSRPTWGMVTYKQAVTAYLNQ